MSTNEAAERLRVYARQLPGFPFDLLDAALASQRSAEATHLWVGDHGVATGGNVERSAGAAPIEHPLGEVGHILAHYAIDDEDWEALRPFIRSAGAAPTFAPEGWPLTSFSAGAATLDVLREAFSDFDPCHECDNAEKAWAALARLSEGTDR
jgi:hypothetical protein